MTMIITSKRHSSLLLFLLFFIAATAKKETKKDEFRVAGYLPDYRFYINVDETAPFLTDLYLFSISPDQTGLRKCCLEPHHYKAARKAKASSSSPLKIWVTLGGGGRSEGFADLFMDSNPSNMMEAIAQMGGFMGAVKDIVKEEELDGIIFDCEHFTSQEDYNGYLRLIRKMTPALKQAEIGIAVAVHVGQYLGPDMYKKIDQIHLMSYDIADARYHGDLTKVQQGVKGLIDSGCPPEKIMLGIPSYARHTDNQGDVKTFAEIVDGMDGDDGALSGDWKGYLYESPTGVQEKVAFAKKEGLAGVFFWELGQDKQNESAPGGILLQAASKAASAAPSRSDEL